MLQPRLEDARTTAALLDQSSPPFFSAVSLTCSLQGPAVLSLLLQI